MAPEPESGPRALYYVADPMCSWCWGFAPVLAGLEPRLAPDVELRLLLGGLAPDSDEPMEEPMRAYVQHAWRAVEARTGARFEHALWERCRPRRSTWPACRAVLAAGPRGREMFDAVQRAFYLEARDPSDVAVLHALARELGLDAAAFARDLDAPATRAALEEGMQRAQGLGVTGFPSLALADPPVVLTAGWVDAATLERALGAAELLA